MRSRWMLLAALLVGCQEVTATPSAVLAPPTTTPLILNGLPFAPGSTLRFSVPADASGMLLVANVSETVGDCEVALTPPLPASAATATPSASPTAPVSPSPSPSGGSVDVGFGGPLVGPGARGPFMAHLLDTAPRTIGSEETFWINDGDAQLAGDRQRRCRLVRVSPHAYVYVDDAAADSIPDPQLDKLVTAFETHIQPTLAPLFGDPLQGPDGDAHVFLVLSPWLGQSDGRSGLVGYFWPRDAGPPGGSGNDLTQHANDKPVVFLSTSALQLPDVTWLGTLAHEYMHLLTYTDKSRAAGAPRTEDTWLNEGVSMLAMDLCGDGLQGGDRYVADEVSGFETAPQQYSLTDWSRDPNGCDYGESYLFLRYLADRFGIDLIQDVVYSPQTGIAGLQSQLALRGTSFAQVFLDWAGATGAAKSHATPGYTWFDPTGAYGDEQLPGLQTQSADAVGALSLLPWSFVYLRAGARPVPSQLTLTQASTPMVVLDAGKGGEP
ncbi:MAG TPA: hypothetical protein V6D47_06545 [Oscillatoriaceae cyanobacterium]